MVRTRTKIVLEENSGQFFTFHLIENYEERQFLVCNQVTRLLEVNTKEFLLKEST